MFLVWRVWITKDLLKICIRSIKQGNYLPIFLFGAAGDSPIWSSRPTNQSRICRIWQWFMSCRSNGSKKNLDAAKEKDFMHNKLSKR